MNEIKIYLNPSGSTAELYKDFNLYQESYRNTQITLYVPTVLLYENTDGTYLNAIKTGAILTAPNGAKVTTKSFNAEYVKTVEINGAKYAVYTQIMPKEYVLYAGTQIIVCNVLNIDNTNASAPQIISVTTSQVVPLTVLASAYLDNDEPLDPTEAEVIEGLINSLQKRLDDGEYATRALYAWNSEYIYGVNELVSYPQKGKYGAIIKSLVADNKQNPYVDGEINSQYWSEIIDFNILNGLYGLKTELEEAAQSAKDNAAAAGQSASSAEDAAQTATSAAERLDSAANYLESVQSGETAVPKAVSDGNGENIADQFTEINEKIPSTASEDNQLADKAFVNSSINAMAAFYITSNADGEAFPTKAALLSATTFYSGGQERTPTQNDYAIVLADESQPVGVDGSHPTTRYSYQGGTYPNGQWDFQYVVNNTSLTQAQVNAINSGITAQKITEMEEATAAKYTKPTGGIPESDLSSAVQDKLNENGASPSNTAPLMDGTASVGTSTEYARGDHRHPSDTSKADTDGDYPDMAAGKLSTARAIDGVSFDGSADINHYVNCTTAAYNASKTVTKSGFVLADGARITVKFTNGDTSGNPTLNVSNTGAYPMIDLTTSDYLKTTSIPIGTIIDFIFIGYSWIALNVRTPRNQLLYSTGSLTTGQKSINNNFSRFDGILFVGGTSQFKTTCYISSAALSNYNSNNDSLIITFGGSSNINFIRLSYDNTSTFTVRDKSSDASYLYVYGIKY